MPVSNLGRIGFVTKGDWSAGEYKYLDVVKHVAATWICAVPTTDEEPGAGTDWQNALTAPAVTGIAEWSQLTGTQSPPLIVYDDQKYWTLITTVSDIAENKPSESPDVFRSNGLIDDTVTSDLTTWSSEKINEELDTKYAQNNILGTVSQSGGVPTGAIIESGSNANGEFVRYADGTQICWIGNLQGNGSSAVGNTASDVRWDMPIAFANTAYSGSIHHGGQAGLSTTQRGGQFEYTGTSSDVRARYYTPSGVNASDISFSIRLVAIGKWY